MGHAGSLPLSDEPTAYISLYAGKEKR